MTVPRCVARIVAMNPVSAEAPDVASQGFEITSWNLDWITTAHRPRVSLCFS